MTEIVVDASIAIKWVIPEVQSELASKLLGPQYSIAAPDFILLECASILWKQVRFAALPSADAESSYHSLIAMQLELWDTGSLIPRAFEIAVDSGRTVYDSVYLALAELKGIRMVTSDLKLFTSLSASKYSSLTFWIENI